MRSPEPPLCDAYRERLLGLARASVEHGLAQHRALPVEAERWPEPLRRCRASFVTLRRGGTLRGCTGTLSAHRPLVEDVASNAWRSASGDPRFPAVAPHELPELRVHVSVLGPLEPLPAASEGELLRALRPGIDGLVLEWRGERSTFLPAVWRSLRTPRQFLLELKRKAGLPADHWSGALCFERYSVEEFPAAPD